MGRERENERERERGGKRERERGYHLRGRQLGHVRDVRERVLGCGVLAVGVGAGLGVVDLRVVLARDVLLVVFHLARLRAALRLAARVFPLGRHRRSARATGTRGRVWIYSGTWRVRAGDPPLLSFPLTLSRSARAGEGQVDGARRWFHAGGCRGDIYRCNGAEGAAPRRRRRIGNKNAATWRSKIIIKPCSRDKYIHIRAYMHARHRSL